MSSKAALFALVAGYVGIVLWCLAFGDSLASLRARVGSRAQHWRHKLGLALDRSGAGGAEGPGSRGSHRYLTRAVAGFAIAFLTVVAVVGARDLRSKGNVGPEAALGQQSAEPASLQPSRALSPPAAAADAKTPARALSPPETHPKVVSNLVRVSARVTPAASRTLSMQGSPSDGPAPLPAPPGNSPPSPLAAP